MHLSTQVGQHQPVHADGAPRVDAEEAGEGAGGDQSAAEPGRKVGKNNIAERTFDAFTHIMRKWCQNEALSTSDR